MKGNTSQRMSINKCVVPPKKWCNSHHFITLSPKGKANISKILRGRTKNIMIITWLSWKLTVLSKHEYQQMLVFEKVPPALRYVQKGRPIIPKYFELGKKLIGYYFTIMKDNTSQRMSISKCLVFEKVPPEKWRYVSTIPPLAFIYCKPCIRDLLFLGK